LNLRSIKPGFIIFNFSKVTQILAVPLTLMILCFLSLMIYESKFQDRKGSYLRSTNLLAVIQIKNNLNYRYLIFRVRKMESIWWSSRNKLVLKSVEISFIEKAKNSCRESSVILKSLRKLSLQSLVFVNVWLYLYKNNSKKF
jgi:hypothetical protein